MIRLNIVPLTILFLCIQTYALAQPSSGRENTPPAPTLTVAGSGQVSAAPDQAVVQFGVVARSEKASDAQNEANRIAGAILEAIQTTGIAKDKITTAELTLSPIHEQQDPREGDRESPPRIVGYLATNMLRVEIDEMNKIGNAIDAAIGAGANRLENLSFKIKDETPLREKALRQAVLKAREKAVAIAETLNLRLVRILQITEESVGIVEPRFRVHRMAAAAAESTPVEPGRIEVNASAIMDYQIEEKGGPPSAN